MGTQPIFAVTPRLAVQPISAANPNRDGTGTVVNIFTAGASGSRVERIRVKAIVTTTAGLIRIFIHDGVNFRLVDELEISAIVVSASVAGFEGLIGFTGGLLLPSGFSLRASTEKAETFNVFVEGGDF